MGGNGGLDDAIALHRNVATRFKEYELTDGEMPPPVVLNELRYGLRASMKLVNMASFDHLDDEGIKKRDLALQELNHGLRNAYHDLLDGLLIQLGALMDDMVAKYPVATQRVLGPRRMDILADINSVEALVMKTRGQGENRDELYESDIYDNWFAKMVEHHRLIDQVVLYEVIREDENVQAENHARQLQIAEANRGKRDTLLLGLAGLIATIAFGVGALIF